MTAHVVSVNAGSTRRRVIGSRVEDTAIGKRPLDGAVEVDDLGLVPDEQADRRHHGGSQHALYAFADEDYDYWSAALGRPLTPGQFGENLTTRGIDVNAACIGERWRIGDIVVQVTGPRIPCATFAAHIGEAGWVRRFSAGDRPGACLRVITPGLVRADDEIVLVDRPDHNVTVSDSHRVYRRDRHETHRLVGCRAL